MCVQEAGRGGGRCPRGPCGVGCGQRSLRATLALPLPPGQGDPDGSGPAVLCQHADRQPLGRPAEAPGHRAGAGEQPSCHVLRRAHQVFRGVVGGPPPPTALQGWCLLQPQKGDTPALPAPSFSPSVRGPIQRPDSPLPRLRPGDPPGLRLAHRPVLWGRARRGVRRHLTGPLDLQRPGQRLLLPGGVPDEGAGPGRAVHHLHHPPAQCQALRAVRPGTQAPLAHGGVFISEWPSLLWLIRLWSHRWPGRQVWGRRG